MRKLTIVSMVAVMIGCCIGGAFAGVMIKPKPGSGNGGSKGFAESARAASTQQVVGSVKPQNVMQRAGEEKPETQSPSCLTQNGCLIVVKIVDNDIKYSFVDFELDEQQEPVAQFK